ncbi:MAG: type II secretion system inner membrane protein GspF [Betaproteobacteria bacterium]|nr:type II secretion system inner membrane protein GspF [Betaproteobacteria bacterium]
MPGYKFTAYDLQGREQRGVLESDSPRLARAELRERGLFPLDVAEISAANDANVRARRAVRLSTADLARVTRQQATLLGAGLTVEQAYNALVEQAESEGERQLLAGVRGAIREGSSLSDALAAYPGSFSDLYRTLVTAGETSGKLGDVLERLADYVEEQQALQQKLLVALIYPAIVFTVCVLVVTGLMTYVVPKVIAVFAATKQTLPLLTRALMALSDFLQATGWFWLGAVVVGYFGVRAALAREAVRFRWHRTCLSIPLLGPMLRAKESAQLAATLSILVGSGVPVLSALAAGAGVVGNLPMRQALQRATIAVREGAGLARALTAQQGNPPLFPPVMVHLIASGEASGRLTQTLESAARQQQRDVETRTGIFAAMVEPAMILVMGVIVLGIVLAVLLPIFELNQLVGK